jgi:ethanolamine ammonia-lyase small subunit
MGRAGHAYSTAAALALRSDHAAARDAVYAEIDLTRDLGVERIERFGLFQVTTQARTRTEFLLYPDRGRLFDDSAQDQIHKKCAREPDLQIVLGDGLSAQAVARYGSVLLDLIWDKANTLSWRLGIPFLIKHCRVGILNEIGRLLDPEIVVLLIGERPGLAQAESLSAYLAYHPQPTHTDAQRNLISNIHENGVPPAAAADRILDLACTIKRSKCSGIQIKEHLGVSSRLVGHLCV